MLKRLFGTKPVEVSELTGLLNLYLCPIEAEDGWLCEELVRLEPKFKELLELDTTRQAELLLLVACAISKKSISNQAPYQLPNRDRSTNLRARFLVSALLRRKQSLNESQFTKLCVALIELGGFPWVDPRAYFPAFANRYLKAQGSFTDEQIKLLKELIEHFDGENVDSRKWAKKLRELVLEEGEAPLVRILRNGEVFANQLLDDLEAMSDAARGQWAHLLDHASNCSAGKPTKKWEKRACELIGEVGEERFAQFSEQWLLLVDKPALEVREIKYGGSYSVQFDPMSFSEPNLDALKGLAWMSGLVNVDELTRALGFVGVSAYKKIPGIGPRATRLGNACVWALGNVGSEAALSQLAMMKVRVKFGTAQKSIEKALQRLADQVGVSTDELEEMSVPSYGLTDVGRMEESLGDYTAVLEVVGQKPVLSFLKPDGNPQKTLPASLKQNFADDIKEIKGSAKDLEKMLVAQKERIDNLFLLQKSWPLPLWRERYLDHPVVGVLARRLIWSFESESEDLAVNGIWYEGTLRNSSGEELSLPADAVVRLWHPIESAIDEIVGWRSWLFEHLIQQPFKQAHREIYLLTDAERTTGTYSNRFASHMLKQHQFNSLCAVRGWKNRLRLMVDDEYPPAFKLLPQWGIRAEYWVEGVGDDYTEEYVLESGAYRYLATDQVRFYRIDAEQATAHAGGGGYSGGYHQELEEPLAVESIPAIVLSEILRDVDLFVGVTSVGNDPNWVDGGPEGAHRDYWQSYSFGELGESAELRKQMLELLLPRLKIAKQCSLIGKFLVVEGSVRTYKIHLGSGNILMEPNDQYLCIVKAPARAKKSEVFLPFEGDGKMAMILSKAFLLAADDKIKDSTILSQIRRQ
ncbi:MULTISPECIES: DUF4132 domain-containing protein [unclassified Lentimonas]|uniref:DUF4132 domain-containing protein n=1 Tax=unclassified Lentimonas TaxID=2630993 RepID=UPI00132647FA|nr:MULTISPECIES: DUF4132 domain-containing protein [unclassified Lentimonas]CAA6676888.1 FIG01130473: hypothetical protein [Lentimonas sp. CC4]CAA6686694.1 FIG01130473: hypothetical protein [Lentimonas sp. CC6]CAA7075729.1 FIG01130473: hypothetical protein [Lentimonas sp. CC4]CAA7168112.1 FIG01130473: hypothetical protein [Lentimonas sp. CC21]CAA7181740.1 FIG01130473: hypothetical protein [Lentimonas sp. CC8]